MSDTLIHALLLDKNFDLLCELNYIELQWNRKYYECGDFSIQLRAEDYDDNAKYVYTSNRKEFGIIQKVENSEKINGKFVQISGFFEESILNKHCVFSTYSVSNQKLVTSIRNMVKTYLTQFRDSLHINIEETQSDDSENVSFQRTGDELGTAAYELLKQQNYSYKIEYNYLQNRLDFSIYIAENKSDDVTFSKTFGNLVNPVITEDDSNYKNYAIVQGEEANGTRTTVYVDNRSDSSEELRVLYVDARDIQSEKEDGSSMSAEEYTSLLEQRGKEKLAERTKILNVEFQTVNNNFLYLEDYDLGDVVTICVEANNKMQEMTARIIEIREVIRSGKNTITLTIGDKIPTQSEKVRY